MAYVVNLDGSSAQTADLLVDLEDVGPLRCALLQHAADQALDRVRVGRVRRDLSRKHMSVCSSEGGRPEQKRTLY